jgi:LacI family transcriptional regulator
MRGTGRISDETREKVLNAARKLHYLPNSRAAAMRSGENREIGFVINQLSNPFNAEVVGGVVDLLETEGYLVSIVDTRDDPERQKRQLQSFIQHGRGGLLWVPAADTSQETFDMLAAQAIPVVTFLRHVRRDLDHVGIRNTDATAIATRYLVDLGHRHIAYLGGADESMVRKERIAGYQRVISESKLGDGLVWSCEDNKLAGMNAMVALQKALPDVTAVVCNGDMVALGACLALIRAGQRPGVDVSVMGFDDIQDAVVATPALSTMAVSPHKLGRKLARTLLDRISDPEMPPIVSEISAELIIRETTGAPPS